jgi:hypothetical protein
VRSQFDRSGDLRAFNVTSVDGAVFDFVQCRQIVVGCCHARRCSGETFVGSVSHTRLSRRFYRLPNANIEFQRVDGHMWCIMTAPKFATRVTARGSGLSYIVNSGPSCRRTPKRRHKTRSRLWPTGLNRKEFP